MSPTLTRPPRRRAARAVGDGKRSLILCARRQPGAAVSSTLSQLGSRAIGSRWARGRPAECHREVIPGGCEPPLLSCAPASPPHAARASARSGANRRCCHRPCPLHRRRSGMATPTVSRRSIVTIARTSHLYRAVMRGSRRKAALRVSRDEPPIPLAGFWRLD